MKLRLLFGCLLLLAPLLAHADPLNNGALGFVYLLELLTLGFAGLTMLLVVLAFLRPASRVLYVLQACLLLLFLGISCTQFGGIGNSLGAAGGSACTAVVPLALLLNSVQWARRARRPSAYRCWASLAAAGSANLLWQLLYGLGLRPGWQAAAENYAVGVGSYLLLLLVVSLLAWGLVLVLLRYHQLAAGLWPPAWWRVPTLAAGFGIAYAVLDYGRTLAIGPPVVREPLLSWQTLTVTMAATIPGGPRGLHLFTGLLLAATVWVAGVVLLRLFRPDLLDEAAEALPVEDQEALARK